MRRVLNLNQPGTVFLKLIGLFIGLIPAVLYCVSLLLRKAEFLSSVRRAIKISFAIGAFVFVVLLVLIIAEQIQDHYIDLQYQKNRARKLRLANGYYECQYCGNQKVRVNDQLCQVCGKELQ